MRPARKSKVELIQELEAVRASLERVERAYTELKGRFDELSRSEALFRSIVENSQDGMFRYEFASDAYVYLSPAFEALTGYNLEELRRFSVAEMDELSAPEYRDANRQATVDLVNQPPDQTEPQYLEELWKGKHGELRWHSQVRTLIRDSQGRPEAIVGVVRDATRAKAIEEALRKNEQFFRSIVENTTDIIYRYDVQEGAFTYLSPSAKALTGFTLDDLRAMKRSEIDERNHPDFRNLIEQANEELLRSGRAARQPQHLQYLWRCKDGIYRWHSQNRVLLRDEKGNPETVFGVIRDITEEKEMEQALRETEARFREILENSRDVAYKFNLTENVFEYISPSVQEVSGYAADRFLGVPFADLKEFVHPDDRDRVVEAYRHLLPGLGRDSAGLAVEFRWRHKDGDYRWVADCPVLLWGPDGMPTAVIGGLRDITREKETEKALLAASRMEATATLAGGVAHDFNNLMVGVLGNAELLAAELKREPEYREMLSDIATAAQRAGKLAQQMLAFARGGRYQPTLINLNPIVREVVQLEERALPSRVTLHWNLEPELWNTKADPAQMSQVVMNLLINAVEAIEKRGTITVETANKSVDRAFAQQHPGMRAGRYVRFSVTDTGHGMSPETQVRVFEPFFTTKFQGRGLGLAAVYGIVKNHGGYIMASSVEECGTTFSVYLPATLAMVEESGRPGKTVPGGHETILVIDDDATVLNVAKRVLHRLGYGVIEAQDPSQALEAARGHIETIDLALLDLGLPGMDGIELFPLLKAARPDMRVIVCTGYDLGDDARRLLDMGADTLVQKPFNTETLGSTVRKVLDG